MNMQLLYADGKLLKDGMVGADFGLREGFNVILVLRSSVEGQPPEEVRQNRKLQFMSTASAAF